MSPVAVFWVPSPKFTAGRQGEAVVALVHHRMVGTLRSTDTTFTTGTRVASTQFGVGYDCGRAGHPTTEVHVHQYVNLDDMAWGNGNLDATGSWDDVWGATPNPNLRTISIEHHDNGGSSDLTKRGIVPEPVIAASIELDRLLVTGDTAEWSAAGIRWRSLAAATVIAAQLQNLVPGPTTLVDHHYIAGRLKPYCWRPWSADTVGFPQARYIAALRQEDAPMIQTSKGEEWRAKSNASFPAGNGVLRSAPSLSAPIIARLATGKTIGSLGEYRDPAGNQWRQTALGSRPAWLLYRKADGTSPDWEPVTPGGDPAVAAELSNFISRTPDATPYDADDLETARAAEEARWKTWLADAPA